MSRVASSRDVSDAGGVLKRNDPAFGGSVESGSDLGLLVREYDSTADTGLIERAYDYALEMHGSQKRASGEPYYSHPVQVAMILASLRLDSATIATALLHDTIEDTEATPADIERLFGGEVAGLVRGVTKLTRLELISEESRQAEDFRKLLLAISGDVRVLLVKLADRLHNMRTLRHLGQADKRRRIAQETMDIFAPLAGRMGMQDFREELEDLAFAELNSEMHQLVTGRLNRLREGNADAIRSITAQLEVKLSEHGLTARVSSREKRPYAIWRKMEGKSLSFEQLSDIIGFRVVVEGIGECYRALGTVHTTWQTVPGSFKDYISTPKANGYRSIHSTVIGPERKRVELQIRTERMHEAAEYGIAAHWFYKEAGSKGGVPSGGENAFRWLRQLVEMLEHSRTPEEFLEHTKLELFRDQVFCFTPKGRLIALPRGATPIDFAYAVHTRVGDTCVGSRINGRHMPLRTRLNNGDEVEIIRSPAQTPAPVWEQIVTTGKARAAIRRSLRQTRNEEYAQLGRSILNNVFGGVGRKAADKVLERALVPLKMDDLDHLLSEVGSGALKGRTVLETVYPDGHRSFWRRPTATAVSISGLRPGTAVHIDEGGCPVPGDPIVGIVMPGRGITIYRMDSDALRAFDDEPDRWVDVSWDVEEGDGKMFVSRLTVVAANSPGVLGTITTLIGDYDGNIIDLKVVRQDIDFCTLRLSVEVRELKHLTGIVAALRGLSVVNSAERVRAADMANDAAAASPSDGTEAPS